MKIYSTAERKVVDFVPLEPGKVSFYACGPTVYNFAHVGNLRTYLFEDLMRRAFELDGYEVKHVMNITDVGHLTDDGDEGEDKMIKAAREQGMNVWEIAEHFTQAFMEDTAKLGIKTPHIVCKATDHIQEMIDLISKLEKNGLTYQAGGNVYFDVQKFPDYGKMAGLQEVELQSGARVALDEHKRDPRDFVLWFTKGKFENQAMIWNSPWGKGYPGWHLECSAMSMKYLGDKFDIHAGGVDHIHVHHTNEIAQSEGATGEPWVKYWVHGEFLLMDKAKMSKSSGDFLTLQKLEEQGFHPLDYRYFNLGGHYRSQLTFSQEAMEAAKTARANLNNKVLLYKKEAGEPAEELSPDSLEIWSHFKLSILNDLNAPQALAQLWTLIKSDIPAAEKLAVLYKMDDLLGLGLRELEAETVSVPQVVLDLDIERQNARKSKNWAKADEIRDKMQSMGWKVKDTPQGPEFSGC
jgi:cysteinyl-tRNA synthetase